LAPTVGESIIGAPLVSTKTSSVVV